MKRKIKQIIEDQTANFHQFSPLYIINHYKCGPSDLILRFYKGTVGIIKGEDLFENKEIVNVRCSAISVIMQKALQKNPELVNQIDVVVPFCFSDHSDSQFQHIPALTFCKERSSNNILIPSYMNLIGYPELETVRNVDRPLFHKQDKMCFAGSLTNVYWNGKGIEHNDRLKLAAIAQNNPDKMVCGLIIPPRHDLDEWGKIRSMTKDLFNVDIEDRNEKMSIDEQLKYKFQLCADGHVSAWSRLPWQMASNSVVIKIRNRYWDFVEWFYYLMVPGKHLVEVDIDDLMDFYDFIVREPYYQQALCDNATDFFNTYINVELAQDILVETLVELTKKQGSCLGEIE